MHAHAVNHEKLAEWHDELFECDILLCEDDKSPFYRDRLIQMSQSLSDSKSVNETTDIAAPTAALPPQRPPVPRVTMEPFSGRASDFMQYDRLFQLHFEEGAVDLGTRFLALRNYFGPKAGNLLAGIDCTEEGYSKARQTIKNCFLSGSKVRVEAIRAVLPNSWRGESVRVAQVI